jgi:hypothetical protein
VGSPSVEARTTSLTEPAASTAMTAPDDDGPCFRCGGSRPACQAGTSFPLSAAPPHAVSPLGTRSPCNPGRTEPLTVPSPGASGKAYSAPHSWRRLEGDHHVRPLHGFRRPHTADHRGLARRRLAGRHLGRVSPRTRRPQSAGAAGRPRRHRPVDAVFEPSAFGLRRRSSSSVRAEPASDPRARETSQPETAGVRPG